MARNESVEAKQTDRSTNMEADEELQSTTHIR